MQALLENEVVNLYTQDRVISEFDALMESAKTADATLKSKIENEIVAKGMKFVPELIEHIQSNRGITRGICAMSLIRIGKDCIASVKEAASINKEFAWAANYILNEIR
ncbi:MAG: hypothetical protein MJ180_02195 [Candidatus Gastranaerophilales bacterium]|nr:hypothetical protein [Candidatus Gastranaerophilales bacterium]